MTTTATATRATRDIVGSFEAARYRVHADDLNASATVHPTSLAVLRVDKLPRGQRMVIETLLVDTLTCQPPPAAPGTDVFDACWFTRWRSDGPATVSCKEVINGTPDELDDLKARLAAVARHTGCIASVTDVVGA